MDIAAVQAFRLQPVGHRYTARDTILYGLGLGLGSPLDDVNLSGQRLSRH